MSKYEFNAEKKTQLHPRVKKVKRVFFVIVIFFLSILFLPWQQTVKGDGKVTAYDPTQRDYTILATMDGLIKAFHVKENTFVKKGTPLFTMVDIDKEFLSKLKQFETGFRAQYTNTEDQIKNLTEKKKNLRNYLESGLKSYVRQQEKSKNRILSLEQKKISLQKSLEVAKAHYIRTKILFKEGIESKRALEVSENLHTKANVEFRKIDIDIENERLHAAVIENETDKFREETENRLQSLSNSMLTVENSLKVIDQSIQESTANVARYSAGEVVAEKDGYVVRILQNDQHKLVRRGESVMLFSPQVTTKSLLLKVSDFNMPLIKVGLKARVIFYGWPALQVSGWPKIQFGSYGGIISRVERTLNKDGFYYAQVLEDPKDPWPKGNNLKIGTRATVWVRLETVPVWYQLWRLMNAVPPRMVTPEEEPLK